MTDNDFPCCAPKKGTTMSDNDTPSPPPASSPLDGPGAPVDPSLVAEVERLWGMDERWHQMCDALTAELMTKAAEVERLRGVASDHERWRSLWEERCIRAVGRAEAAEAKVAKVEALADRWDAESSKTAVGIIKHGCATELRAALADAPAEQRAEAGASGPEGHVAGCLLLTNHAGLCRAFRIEGAGA